MINDLLITKLHLNMVLYDFVWFKVFVTSIG